MKKLIAFVAVIAALAAVTTAGASDPANRCAVRTGGAPTLLGGVIVQGWFENLCHSPASTTTEHACLFRTLNANQVGTAIACKNITTGSTGGTVTVTHKCTTTSIIYIWYISGFGSATFTASNPKGYFQSPTVHGPGSVMFCG